MRKQIIVVALTASFWLLAVAPVQAQLKTIPIPNCETDRKPPPAVWKSEANFNGVQKAWEKVADELYAEAAVSFEKLINKIRDPYERTQAMFGLAQTLMATDQFDKALTLYEEIVSMDVLQDKPHFDAMFQIAQLFYMRERYDDALMWTDRWISQSCQIRLEAYDLKASVYAHRDDFRNAMANVDKAIELADEPKESRYQLKLGMHYELKEFEQSRDVLQFMVRQWPHKKQYWTQLSSMHVTLKNDKEALAVLALAHRHGLLEKESDFTQLYSLYGYLDLPYKAAEVLAEGIDLGFVESSKKHWEQLGNAWYAARELDKAVAALNKAANLAEDGKIAVQVGYILIDKEDWSGAKVALTTALDKGGLSDNQTGNMYVLLGMSELNIGEPAAARRAFMEARKFQKSRQSAQQWINHLNELEKRERAGP
jgi:tetratricopeptide (TPR) repeat protein